MSRLTTHVLDAVRGAPASDVDVVLVGSDGDEIARTTTDADGRAAVGPDTLEPGEHTLRFETGAYFARSGTETFYPSVSITFVVGDRPHHHVPLLLSPFAYSTYRGS